ncbi:alpha/beta hydrolase [Gilvimarinus sp. SDUM040013]|uniref:Alpha/beta hydrolase n=1 Tax=Gilvimarinus gilvus TaxID=3058038 RepID=A0ABU4RZW9_9GAMM|nr:alpha/beta hydrolase [Gilvimarinus sp. SDUM040013]MDO3384741.1 alpha/beta hydrolase [Gilvimarinus sp. SDUM040013]MDX6850441.1 alpha/beta hydrolase [Gilvimarinus sp. SDUM040013]
MRYIISLCALLFASSLYAQEVIPLWEDGAPGFEHLKDEPELAQDWWVKNIHNPSITAFFPDPNIATGGAVLIAPGGGHRELVFEAEGVDAAKFYQDLGIAAFVLKYRLANESESPYSYPEHSTQDAARAMRVIRHNAKQWNINPDQLGMMGFSAGGEVAMFISFGETGSDSSANDPIERLSAKPDFQVLVYPGFGGLPDKVSQDAPPLFTISAGDDTCCRATGPVLYMRYLEAKADAEAHFYSSGGHGFNMGQRATDRSIANWSGRLKDWLLDRGLARTN